MKSPLILALAVALPLCVSSAAVAQPHDYQQFVPGQALIAQFHLKERCYGMSAVPIGDFIYLFGGDTPPETVGTIERIDTRTNTIETLEARIEPRYLGCATAIGEVIYIFGGAQLVNPFSSASTVVERFDTRTGKVTTLEPSPRPLSMTSSASMGDKIYILGKAKWNGENPGKLETTLWIYDSTSDQWTKGASLPVARTCRAIGVDGTIYALGGFGDGAAKTCEAYDIASNTWHKLPDLPFGTSGHDLAVVDNSIFAFGDYTDMSRVQRFDLKTQTWQRLFFTGYDARRFPSVCAINKKIYVMGGKLEAEGYYLDEVQVFDAAKLK